MEETLCRVDDNGQADEEVLKRKIIQYSGAYDVFGQNYMLFPMCVGKLASNGKGQGRIR